MITVSVISHGQSALVDVLIGDLVRAAPQRLQRLVLTLNLPEPEPPTVALAPFEIVILRNTAPLGFGANHNRAFEHCETPWFAILNPDLRVDSDFFQVLADAAQACDGLLAPRVLEPDGHVADAARPLPTPLQLAYRRLGPRTVPASAIDWLAGMCLLVRSEAFRSIGGFDERYRLYCEDVDLCLRLRLSGWRLRRIDAASVVHAAQRASHRSPQHLGWHVSSLLKLWTSGAFWSYLARRKALRRAGC